MISVKLAASECCIDSKPTLSVEGNKKYIVSTEVSGHYGKQYSAYFGIVMLENEKHLDRRILWLDDFTGKKKKYEIVFTTLPNCNAIQCIYRINNETPLSSKCSYEILPTDQITIKKANSSIEENYKLVTQYVIPRLSELNREEEEILEKNLVWIFGSRRSGTTWLRDLLSHKTKYWNEPLIGRIFDFVRESSLDPFRRYIDTQNNDNSYFFSPNYKETWKFYLRKLILNRIYSQFQDLTSKIVIKEPNGTMGADILSLCLPNSKFIFLLRDGRDVIDSIVDGRKKNSWETIEKNLQPITKNNRISFITDKSSEWVKTMEIFWKTYISHQKELKFLIRYENLLNKTSYELKKIYDFIEIEVSNNEISQIVKKFGYENIQDNMKGEGKFVRIASPGRWKKNFSKKEADILNNIMRKTLKRIGY